MSDYYLISSDYVMEGTSAYVTLFCRDSEFRKVCIKVPYSPYFYVKEQDVDETLIWIHQSALEDHYKLEPRKFEADFGYTVKKIKLRFPIDVRRIRTKLERFGITTFEADVLFYLRFLIDCGIKAGFKTKFVDFQLNTEDLIPCLVKPRLKIAFLDIEVFSKKISELRNFTAPIIVVGVYDEDNRLMQFSGSNERELLREVLDYLASEQFDLIVTFSDFDIPYLLNRCAYHKLDYHRLSLIRRVYLKSNKILGTEVIDYLKLYSIAMEEPTWRTLDYIAKQELGRGQINIKIYEEWKKGNKDLVLERNKGDVLLLVDLEKKLHLIDEYALPIKDTVGCNIRDIFYPNRLADILYLRHVKDKLVLMTRSPYKYSGELYLGALVMEAKPGIYNNVAVLDFSEMYPNIIENLNIGWNTFRIMGDNLIEVTEKAKYCRDEESWTSIILKDLRAIRQRIKDRIKQTKDPSKKRILRSRSSAFKALINAVYGLYGFKGVGEKTRASRFYSPIIASSITHAGRLILGKAIEFLKSKGFEVIYADTDSLFFLFSDIEEVELLKNELENYTCRVMKETWNLKRTTMLMEVDKVFNKLILLKKKRYYGITQEGEEVVKGIELVRKDVSQITKEIQATLNRMIVRDETDKIIPFLRSVYFKVKRGEVSLDSIKIPGRCSKKDYKVLTHLFKALIIGNKLLNQELELGERFYWVYIKSVLIDGKPETQIQEGDKTIDLEAIAFKDKLPDSVQIDFNRMAERVVIKPVKKYLDILGISEKVIKGYTTLDRFV